MTCRWFHVILAAAIASAVTPTACAQTYQMTAPFAPAGELSAPALPPGLVSAIPSDSNVWRWRALPNDLIYDPYLASPKESRMSSNFLHEEGCGTLWDVTVGGQLGLLRFGPEHGQRGFQIGVEGSVQTRLDFENSEDVRSMDYRAGIPLTWSWNQQQFKFGYYHLSSHLGDDFLSKNPGRTPLNFVRDTFVLGYSRYLNPDVRVYGEAGWAFHADISEPWEFQAGIDMVPSQPTGMFGAPFLALNAHLREEVNFGGTLTAQTGWAWRSDDNHRLLRIGVQLLNGKSPQYSFFNESEQQIGLGIWYDF